MTDLVEFLIARYDERERDIAAKRKILASFAAADEVWAESQRRRNDRPGSFDLARARSLEKELEERVMLLLAAPYAEHADYDPAWRIDG